MDIEQINQWVEHTLRPDPEETENRFFQDIRHVPDQIPYNQLRQIRFPVNLGFHAELTFRKKQSIGKQCISKYW